VIRGSWFVVRDSWFVIRGSWFVVRGSQQLAMPVDTAKTRNPQASGILTNH
jgi:hypothetical protein